MRRALPSVLAFVACLLLASSASASRVGVGPIRGRGGDAIRDALEESLRRSGHEVIDRTEVDAAGASLTPASIDAEFVLGGRVRRVGEAWVADLMVGRGDARGSRRVRMRGVDPDQLADRVVGFLESRVDGFEPAPPPPPVPEPEPEPVAPVVEAPAPAPAPPPPPRPTPRAETGESYRLVRPPERAPGDPLGFETRNVVELEAAAGLLSRSLGFRDDLFSSVRGYELAGAPAFVLKGRLFPFSRSDVRGLRDLGLEAESEFDLVADSRRPDGQVYPTTSSSWSFGLAYRLPFGHHAFTASLSYGLHSFLIDPAGPASPTNDPRPELPRVGYETLRPSVGLRLAPIAGLVLHVRASYLAVLDAGGITTDVWFPNARTTGFEATFGVGYRLAPSLELRANVNYRRYGLDLRPNPGDPYIVGGAGDQYWLYTLGVAVMR